MGIAPFEIGEKLQGCPMPWSWDFGCSIKLNQTTDLERVQGREVVLFFFFFLHEAKIMGLGEGQLQTPPMAKSNYKL